MDLPLVVLWIISNANEPRQFRAFLRGFQFLLSSYAEYWRIIWDWVKPPVIKCSSSLYSAARGIKMRGSSCIPMGCRARLPNVGLFMSAGLSHLLQVNAFLWHARLFTHPAASSLLPINAIKNFFIPQFCSFTFLLLALTYLVVSNTGYL